MNHLVENEKDQNMASLKANNKLSLVSRYNAALIKKGQKFKSEQAFLQLCRDLKKTYKKPVNKILLEATDEVKPYVGLRVKRFGSRMFKIPVGISAGKELTVGASWVVKESVGRKKGPFINNVHKELISLLKKDGSAKSLEKKHVLHELAENNREFLRYLRF
jgi:ribosomal protein S7